MKKLVRGNVAPSDAVVLSDAEFINTALLTIAQRATDLSKAELNNPTVIVDSFSDILDLIGAVLIKENINPTDVYKNAALLQSEQGTFMDKKAEKE